MRISLQNPFRLILSVISFYGGKRRFVRAARSLILGLSAGRGTKNNSTVAWCDRVGLGDRTIAGSAIKTGIFTQIPPFLSFPALTTPA